MIHLGDVTKIDGATITPVDIVTFGAPCQDISTAGGRKGIQHSEHGDEETTRSGLFYEALRIIKEMRNNDVRNGRPVELLRPRYAIYENVGGLTSSNQGRDFQKVLTEFVRLVEPDAPEIPVPEKGKWPNADFLYGVGADGRPFSLAWRLHDAQYHGVPQRRKRYCVLMDLNGLSAPPILLDAQLGRNPAYTEPDETVADTGAEPRPEVSALGAGLSGDIESCGSTRERSAVAGAEGGAGGAISFQERAGKPGGARESFCNLNTSELCQQPMSKAFSIQGNTIDRNTGQNGRGVSEDVAHTLDETDRHGVAYGLDQQGGKGGANYSENLCPPILSDSHGTPHAVSAVDCRNGTEDPDVNGTLQAKSNGGYDYNCNNVVRTQACDVYNQTVEGNIAPTVTAAAGGQTQAAQRC